jgi:hypothetical protein
MKTRLAGDTMTFFQTALLAAVLVVPALGQISTATLTGLITDPSQARLPHVSVTLTNEETGVASTTTTNPQGEYSFPLLAPGRYKLESSVQGFRGYSRSGILLEMGRVARLDITMELGQLSEKVEVTGAAPLLESESASIGQFIEHKTIADMPLTGRRVGELLGLMGNAVFITGDVIRPRVSIAGGRGDQQQWMLDGVNSSNMALEVPQALFNPPVESVQEIRIQQNSYSAEYGNTSGGVVTISTKSGTNKYHATAYEFLRNDKLDARNFFADEKEPLRWNVFGFTAGGPAIKNRTFFFTSVEWQKQRIGNTRLFTVPSLLQRAGDFSQTTNAAGTLVRVYDPGTTRADPANASRMIRDPFPGNVIPASRFDPVANNFFRNAVQILNLTTWTSKVDHVIGDHDRLSGRFVLHDFPVSNTAVYDEPAADPNANTALRRAYSLLINEIHNFTPVLINDLRFDWQPRRNWNRSVGLDQGWPEKLGLKGASPRAYPRVTASGFAAQGLGTQERVQIPIHDTQFIDAISWFRGAHSVKIGGEFRMARNVDIQNSQMSGVLAFGVQPTALPTVGNTGNAIASMLLGRPDSGSILKTDVLDRRSKYIAFFAQDDWKVTARLTLNLGVRWEAHTPRIDVNNRQSGFDMGKINPISGTPGVVTFAGLDGMGVHVYAGDWNNIGPRVGLAWKPFGQRTVIRSGYGIFYGVPLPGSNTAAAGFQTSGTFQSPDNGITPPFLLRNGFPDTSRAELGPGFGSVRVGQAATFSPEFIEYNRTIGYTQQWNFGIQREIGWNTLVDTSYVASVGHKLNGPNTSINQVPVALMAAGNAQARRPFPQFANVTTLNPMWGNSSYHSLNVKVEKRFSRGLNFLANYTFSKFIDDVNAAQEIGQVGGGIQNLYDRKAEKALSGNDARNRFVISSVYELPVGKGRKWLNHGFASMVLGGWNVGAIGLLQAGSPYGLVMQTNNTNAFNPGSQRVNVLRDPALPASQRSVSRYFDTTAVAAPAPYTFGNGGRAMLTGPGIRNLDMSLLKNHRFREGGNVQFRLESLNILNHANFEEPGRALGSAGFGVISAARDPRILQLGLRLEF